MPFKPDPRSSIAGRVLTMGVQTREKNIPFGCKQNYHYHIYIGGLQSRCAVATRISTKCMARSAIGRGYSHIVILSPNESAIPCVLLRILTCPTIVPDSVFSMLKLARASSPVVFSQYGLSNAESVINTNTTTWDTTTDGERSNTYRTNSVHTCSQKGSRSRQTWRLPVSDRTY